MPKYNMECNDCDEEFVKIIQGNPTTIVCPECGSDNVKKTMPTSVSLRFKGKGFYRTDYKEEE